MHDKIKLALENTEKIKQIELGRNPICLELCNIMRKINIPQKEREIRCNRRKRFSKKMLKKNNTSLILEKIIKSQNTDEKTQLTYDSIRHLSFYQFVCIVVQYFTSIVTSSDMQQLIEICHILLQIKNFNQVNHREEEEFIVSDRDMIIIPFSSHS